MWYDIFKVLKKKKIHKTLWTKNTSPSSVVLQKWKWDNTQPQSGLYQSQMQWYSLNILSIPWISEYYMTPQFFFNTVAMDNHRATNSEYYIRSKHFPQWSRGFWRYRCPASLQTYWIKIFEDTLQKPTRILMKQRKEKWEPLIQQMLNDTFGDFLLGGIMCNKDWWFGRDSHVGKSNKFSNHWVT